MVVARVVLGALVQVDPTVTVVQLTVPPNGLEQKALTSGMQPVGPGVVAALVILLDRTVFVITTVEV